MRFVVAFVFVFLLANVLASPKWSHENGKERRHPPQEVINLMQSLFENRNQIVTSLIEVDGGVVSFAGSKNETISSMLVEMSSLFQKKIERIMDDDTMRVSDGEAHERISENDSDLNHDIDRPHRPWFTALSHFFGGRGDIDDRARIPENDDEREPLSDDDNDDNSPHHRRDRNEDVPPRRRDRNEDAPPRRRDHGRRFGRVFREQLLNDQIKYEFESPATFDKNVPLLADSAPITGVRITASGGNDCATGLVRLQATRQMNLLHMGWRATKDLILPIPKECKVIDDESDSD